LRAFAGECDRIIVVAPARLRAAVATAWLLQELPPVDTALVVRASRGAALDAPLIAGSVGLVLQGIMPDIRDLAGATEVGRLLETGRHRAVRRFAAGLLELNGGDDS